MIKLDNYQQEILKKLNDLGGRGIITLPPGTGKTYVSCKFIEEHYDNKSFILILCPKSKIGEWTEDAQKLLPNTPVYTNKHYIQSFGVFIINYQQIKYLDLPNIKYVIIDESHNIKNVKTSLFKELYSFLKRTNPQYILCLTGTPTINHPYEIYAQIKLVAYDKKIIDWKKFKQKFCFTKINKYNQEQFIGIKNKYLLKKFIDKYLINNEQIKQEIKLPPLHIKWIKIPNKNYKKYNNEELSIIKAYYTCKYIKKIKNKSPDEQIVIFTWFKETAKLIMSEYPDAEFIHGQLSTKKRNEIINKFKNKKFDILIVNMKAAGAGLNLQNACVGIVADLVWTPGMFKQAIKRIHRRGSTKPVYVLVLYVEYTIDEAKLKVMKRKNNIIKQLQNNTIVKLEKTIVNKFKTIIKKINIFLKNTHQLSNYA